MMSLKGQSKVKNNRKKGKNRRKREESSVYRVNIRFDFLIYYSLLAYVYAVYGLLYFSWKKLNSI